MDYTHEMRIESRDRKKIIRYAGEDAYMHWTDTYNSASAVIGDDPEQFENNDVLVGRLRVNNLDWSKVIQIMIDEAGLMSEQTEISLLDDQEISYVD